MFDSSDGEDSDDESGDWDQVWCAGDAAPPTELKLAQRLRVRL